MIEFDNYANEYDAWFIANENVLLSELKLVAHALKEPGKTLSVGCGSGLFEMLLRQEYQIEIKDGIEPSKSMAKIAESRGMTVKIGGAEEVDFGIECYDTVIFNGSPSYITDLKLAFENAYKALKTNGRIIVVDVPKESGYALIYNLAKTLGTWQHPLLADITPLHPYPIELVELSNWRTTAEKVDLLHETGFVEIEFAQTLTKHPMYSNIETEEPIKGYEKGDYAAIIGRKI